MERTARDSSKDAEVLSEVNYLAGLAAKGDRDALKKLFELWSFRNRLRAICEFVARRKNADPEVLEQEAYVRIMERIDSFQGGAAFTTWAFRVITNLQTDILRKKNRQLRSDRSQEELFRRRELRNGDVEQKRINEIALKTAISKLDRESQDLLQLKAEGYTLSEISLRTGQAQSTVHQKLQKLLVQLMDV